MYPENRLAHVRQCHELIQKSVSVIIPTLNSEATLRQCLSSLVQNHPPQEVIVVDAESADSTQLIAMEFRTRLIVRECRRSAARNLGAAAASGDLLLFIDADMKCAPDLILRCSSIDVNAACIGEISIGKGFWAGCLALEKKIYERDPVVEAARLFSRLHFLRLGGYDENLEAGEDWDIHYRFIKNGYKIAYIKEGLYHLEGQPTLSSLLMKKMFYGRTILHYLRKNGLQGFVRANPIRVSFLRRIGLLASDPTHAVGLVGLKILQAYAALLGMLLGPVE